jgi:hypothetical protein
MAGVALSVRGQRVVYETFLYTKAVS